MVSATQNSSQVLLQAYGLVEADLERVKASLKAIITPKTATLKETLGFSLDTTGKLLRPVLSLLVANSFGPVSNAQIEVAAVTEMIHLATLLHDDVLDESDLRRGKPTVRAKWSNTLAILSGDYLLAVASHKLAQLNNCGLVALYAQVLCDLCDGEVIQSDGAFSLDLANLEALWQAYLDKTTCKTASLFSAACKGAAMAAENSDEKQIEAAGQFGHHFGLAFQLMDDVLDMTQDAATLGKPAFGDLAQGLLTAPILLGLQSEALSDADRAAFCTTIEAYFNDATKMNEVLLWLEKSNGLNLARQQVRYHAKQAASNLIHLPKSQSIKVLEAILEASLSRLN